MDGRHHVRRRTAGPWTSLFQTGDRPLRIVLSSLLGVLVVVGMLASSIPRHHARVLSTVSPAGSTPSASRPPRSVTPGSGPTTTGSPPTTIRPGQRATAGHGCGLGLRARTTPAPVGRCTVLEIGDSIGGDLGWGLARRLHPGAGLDLVQADKSSTGLDNTAFWNWPAELATDLAHDHPQLVIVSMGGNDEQGLYVNGSAVEFPSAAWKVAYVARVRQIVHEATSAGAYVLWVGMPIMQQPEFSEGMLVLNSLYRQGTASDPNATFLSVWSLFADPAGQYAASADVNGSSMTLREPDGVHYSFAGEDVIATYVLAHLATIFHVRITPVAPAVITGWS
jgi:lysophospholipase L1-like esterase